MEQDRPEFFLLDEIDRKVLFWLMDHAEPNAIKSWTEFVAEDYKRRKAITINCEKLFRETQER